MVSMMYVGWRTYVNNVALNFVNRVIIIIIPVVVDAELPQTHVDDP